MRYVWVRDIVNVDNNLRLFDKLANPCRTKNKPLSGYQSLLILKTSDLLMMDDKL